MADVKIDMMLVDQGNSVKKKTGDVKELNGELTRSQKLARSAFSGSTGMAVPGQQMEDYNRGRGAIGTGAAGRDFANQAQGLGGLVRVYATFAANLFAVSAAFNALKNAADTTNLIKGLEQLGVASGVNLPKVAKDLEAASGGAISLRDAMTATAQASSAGMTGENIKRMGEVARNAAQALGVDMSNALDRLTRGITKLEPELLDEIGIFTRTEQASQEYARQLGKTVSSLTSFEKRQAFANAVLAEGEQKFSAIALETNPYNKLLASLKNLSQAGLELVNKVLGPIIDFLSKSPMALAAVLGLIATTLLKQAIPALTQWRTELSENVERTSGLASQNLELFRNYQQDISREVSKNISQSVRDNAEAARTGWEAQQQSLKSSVLKNNKELRGLMRRDLEQASQQDLQALDRVRQQYEKSAGATYQDPGRQQAAQARLAEFQRQEPEIRKLIQAQLDYNKAIDAATPRNLTIHGQLLQRIATDAENAEKKMRLLANAADNAAFSGPISAMRSMHGAIQRLAPSIGLASTAMLYFRGTVTVTAVAIGTLTSAMGNLLGTIGIITGVGMLLSTVLSKNADEAAKASQSLDALKSSGDNLDRVLESISKKSPLQQLSAESLAASGTAMQDLSSAINKAIKDIDATIAARSWWDSFTNALFSVIGKSDEQALEKSITKQLTKVLKASSSSIDAAEIRKQLVRSLGLGEGAGDTDITREFVANIKTAAPELDKIITRFQTSAQSGKAFNDNLKELSKTFKDITNEVMPRGKVIDAITQSTTAFSDLSKIIDGPVTVSIAAMNNLLKNTEALSLLPKGSRDTLLSIAGAVDDVSNRMANNSVAISNATEQLARYEKELDKINKDEQTLRNSARGSVLPGSSFTDPQAGISRRRAEATQAAEAARSAIRNASLEISTDSRLVDGYRATFKKALEDGFKANSELLSQIFSNSIQKARIQAEQTALSKLPVTDAVIDRQAQLQKDQLKIDIQSQLIQSKLILANEKTANELALLRATIALEREERLPQGLRSEKAEEAIRDEIKAGLNIRKAIGSIEAGKPVSMAGLRAMGLEGGDAERLSMLSGAQSAIIRSEAINRSSIDLTTAISKIELKYENLGKTIDEQIAQTNRSIQQLAGLPFSQQNQARADALRQELIRLEDQRQRLGPQKAEEITRIAGPQTKLTAQQLQGVVGQARQPLAGITAATAGAQTLQSITVQTRDAQEELNTYYEKTSAEFKLQADLRNIQNNSLQQTLDYDSQILQIQLDRGIIDQDSFRTKQKELQLKKIELDYSIKIKDLEDQRRQSLNKIAREVESLGGEMGWAGLKPADFERLSSEAVNAGKVFGAGTAAAARARVEMSSILSMQEDLTSRQLAYADVFKNTFDGMADAIVEFAQTGKLNFKDLINSMLADLLRYELRLQMMAMYQSMRPGLMNLIPSLFGASGFSGSSIGFGIPSGAAMAMGGAFDDGVRKYAKGGTFTNSIVDSPTLFRFAKGTGLMGEAGPEAIMPLKRDSQGNLGVRGGGGSVEVVVNNYSGERAEARETVDSRGNRRVEVVVGDMTAGEITRGGSGANRSIRNTFGLSPQLIRR